MIKAISAPTQIWVNLNKEDRQEIISPKITLEVQFVIYNKN